MNTNLNAETRASLDCLEVLLEGSVRSHLEGARASNNAPILKRVLHGAQAVPYSVL